jgi:hypothetical protein
VWLYQLKFSYESGVNAFLGIDKEDAKEIAKLFLKEETLYDPLQFKTESIDIQRNEETVSCSKEALVAYIIS